MRKTSRTDSSGGPIEVEQRGTFSTTYRRSAVDRHLSCQERWFQVSYSRLDLPRWYLTAMLQNVYANSTLSKAQVSRCVSESFTDDLHFRRPLTRITGENVDRIKRRVLRAFPSDCWLPARNEVWLYPSSNLDHNMSLNNSLRSNLTKR
ncbi:uncharacterized protein LOC111272619 isoform X2 [Varroa jacobsoni]|uniref:Uncharacterized protein n=1 Tax=Varroa destructor TaxID=109461 RepID=A0A7M7MFM3_VARDE|nr:uncharacterized protein LOC111255419 [Varroa destructor]XP_022709919.1 uncharacterized protein LOC111272619 isoform X2 [Varroa jacobsoni]